MKKTYRVTLLAFLLIFGIISAVLAQYSQETLNQYLSDLQKNPNDTALREKIIKLVQMMKPGPAIPEEARKRMGRGKAAFKGAKEVRDFNDAADEFQQAVLAAPWLADGYYNLGIAQDRAGQYAAAIESLKLYILAAPNAPDVEKVKEMTCEIEYRKDKVAKESSPEAMAAKKQKENDEWLKKLDGARFVHSFNVPNLWAGDSVLDIRGNKVVVGVIYRWLESEMARLNPQMALGVWMPSNLNGSESFSIVERQFTVPKASMCNGMSWNCSETATISDDGETISWSFVDTAGKRRESVYRRQR